MNQSDFILWLQENLSRLKQTSPKFWKVWTAINSLLLLISGIPTVMAWSGVKDLNQFLPGTPGRIVLRIIAFAAGYALIQNKLTVTSTHKVVVDGDILISKPCPDLPYTEKKESMKIIEQTPLNSQSN